MDLIVNNQKIMTTDEGFLVNPKEWDEETARQLAKLNQIEVTQAHWEILYFIRSYYQQFQHLPNTRMFIKAVAKSLGQEKGNSRYLHQLFPQGPLKYASKLAGLPKPPNCF